MKKIRPLNNRVLVKRAKAQISQGGIILPDSAQEKPKEGEVMATGPGLRNERGVVDALHVKVGDRIFFGAYAGTEVQMEGEDEYLIMSEEDILCVVV